MANESHFDVVVVGAGLSGLQAASDIQQAGLSCVVLEARDRVGGKTWTREARNGKPVDVGAAWINDTNQSKIYALAKRFNLELVKQSTEGDCIMQTSADEPASRFAYGDTPHFPGKERENLIGIRDLVEKLCHSIDSQNPSHQKYDDVTFEEFVKQSGGGQIALASATIWTRVMLGCEPSEMSAMYFLDYVKRGGGLMQMRSDYQDGGQYLRFRTGTQSISKCLAASLKPESVVLSSPVVRIAQTDSGNATVETSRGAKFHCKKVVLSIPTPLYGPIDFAPGLPSFKTDITSATKLGFYAKSILIYRKPWWRASKFCGLSQSFVGPAAVTRDTSDDAKGQYSLTCFVVGELGRAYFEQKQQTRRSTILSQMVSVFGNKHRGDIYDVVDIVEQNWADDEEWSRGAPCPVTGPGVMSRSGTGLNKPSGHVHFVGTETAGVWKGYMDGAVRSGERGAAEVIAAIGKPAKGVAARL